MLTISRDDRSQPISVKFSGLIDERAEFDLHLGNLTSAVKINCKDVTRINSAGIKIWRDFFEKIRKKNVPIEFEEISPALVDVLSVISDFMYTQEVTSLCLTYACPKCKAGVVKTFKTIEIKKMLPQIPIVNCNTCGSACEFDDSPEQYFAFLNT